MLLTLGMSIGTRKMSIGTNRLLLTLPPLLVVKGLMGACMGEPSGPLPPRVESGDDGTWIGVRDEKQFPHCTELP